jgi:predicted CXXCH cytochrome family protein
VGRNRGFKNRGSGTPNEGRLSPLVCLFFVNALFFGFFLIPSSVRADDPFRPVMQSPHQLFPGSASEKSTCLVCHVETDQHPSNSPPLWSHAVRPYMLSGERENRPVYYNQPTGSSLDCLACHDGALGEDVHGINVSDPDYSRVGVPTRPGYEDRVDHPISTPYPRHPDGVFVPRDPTPTYSRYWSIPDKNGKAITLPTGPTSPYFSLPEGPGPTNGYSVTLVRTTQGKVQCDSCHTPHNPQVRPFLRTSPQSLCLICHDR